MGWFIMGITENKPLNESGLIMSIMSNTSKMCQKHQWKFHVPQLISKHCHFAFQTKKRHGVIGLSKHSKFWLDPKLGHDKCAIRWIRCACITCTIILDKPWAVGVSANEQTCYQHVVDCTYCPVFGPLNNCKIIHFSNKSASSEHRWYYGLPCLDR